MPATRMPPLPIDDLVYRLLGPAAQAQRPVRLLFVCTGNICRSPLAQAVFDHAAGLRGLNGLFETESCGLVDYHVGENADERMRACAKRHGVKLDHLARLIAPEDFGHFDLVFAMDSGHLAELQHRAKDPEQLEKIFLYRDFERDPVPGREVPDPYYGTSAHFEAVYRLVEHCNESLIAQLTTAMRRYAQPARA